MKYNIIYLFLSLGLLFASCTDMNHVSKEFLTPEIRYAGSPDTINVLSGQERLVLNFRLADPSISQLKIYWNNKTDSLIQDVVMDVSPKAFNIEIPDLEEKTYSFEIITFDDKGNKSITKTATGRAYGDSYWASLLNTPLKAYLNDTVPTTADGKWGSPDATALGMELYYTNLSGEEISVYVEVPKSETEIFDNKLSLERYKNGTPIRYRTLYFPEKTAIDTFYTNYREIDVRGAAFEYERDSWVVVSGKYDTANNAAGENGNGPRTPQLLLDGNVDSHWHMEKTAYPHSVVINMNETATITGFYVQQRNNLTTAAKTIAFKISNDGESWTSVGEFTMEKIKGKQYFDLTMDVDCSYVELIVKSDYDNGNAGTGLAEFGAYVR